MDQKRTGIITFNRKPMTLVGPELQPGDAAPDFRVLKANLAPVTLADSAGKVRLISVIPSIDTPICHAQTRRFNEEAATLPENVAILTISADLPFALRRWRAAEGIDRIQLLSDYQEHSFGRAYGVLIDELKLLARAIFVVGADGKIVYREIVPEVNQHPDYDAALKAARQAAGE
ncbi:MAG: thiol peroxidase [Armatimonadetes bacterium]|nr:thiol peroxidase [Armatimonadota bacterium]